MKNSLEKLDNELHNELKNVPNKNMHVFSSFSQLTIRCPLLRGKFCPKSSQGPQKVSAIKRFSMRVDHDSAGSFKKCPPLPGIVI